MNLSKQMLEYNPRNNQYNGDDKLHLFTPNHKARRTIKDTMDTCEQLDELFTEGGLTINDFKKGMMFPRLQCRLTSDLGNHLVNSCHYK